LQQACKQFAVHKLQERILESFFHFLLCWLLSCCSIATKMVAGKQTSFTAKTPSWKPQIGERNHLSFSSSSKNGSNVMMNAA
jgi:hypothetical protein